MTQKKTVLTEKEVRDNLIPVDRTQLFNVIVKGVKETMNDDEQIDNLIAEALDMEPEELEINFTDLEEMRVLAVNCLLSGSVTGATLVLDAQDSSCAVLFGSEE